MTHSFDKSYWDQAWDGERAPMMSSGDANPHLVREISGIEPGTALDAGCGAGAEAIWLAGNGWTVTGADVADTALEYAEGRADAAGVGGRIEWVRADLSVWEPETKYDLVTTHYAHPAMAQSAFYDRIASWVAPGGTLLIVGHLHHRRGDSTSHSSAGESGHGHSHPPAEASATADSITNRLDPAVWTIVTAEESQRTMVGPGGRTITIDDVVVRASRRQ
ncbi:MAG: class I SAM-dependent methyltransferase [Brevibacterium sp.]|nr:class I SAM-dependent methyltransferase [Brevibacterium sp.]MDN5909913.1 class I SAM-dependent methyltransferase [Brevibacterium sp.]MDN6176787.1 class I SAM-dependent methyltransferase [Brevibacterium sp.]MDN6188615.1 class I SAM-dependent methyltransferase [Brevibacterium sp.]MDN6191983.1 class I SAM-dependent methyltransferase [Brevibacterium sp.]